MGAVYLRGSMGEVVEPLPKRISNSAPKYASVMLAQSTAYITFITYVLNNRKYLFQISKGGLSHIGTATCYEARFFN